VVLVMVKMPLKLFEKLPAAQTQLVAASCGG